MENQQILHTLVTAVFLKRKKEHTDYFRNNGFSRFKLPPNKSVIQETAGSIFSFSVKKPRLDDMNQNVSGRKENTPAQSKESEESSDSDDDTTAIDDSDDPSVVLN